MFKNIIDLVIGLPDFINNLLKMKDKNKETKYRKRCLRTRI